MDQGDFQVGRVIRLGRGWVDVSVDRKVRRIRTRPDLLIRVGHYLKIINDQGVTTLPSGEYPISNHLL